MPPREAPTATGREPVRLASWSGQRPRVSGEIGKRVGAVGNPFAVAMAALVDRVGDAAKLGDHLIGLAPGVAPLPAAVEQEDRRGLLPRGVADELLSGGAGESVTGLACALMIS